MSDKVDREVVLYTLQHKVKGRVLMDADSEALPLGSSDPYLEVRDATIFEHGGHSTGGRLLTVRLRRSEISMYYIDEG